MNPEERKDEIDDNVHIPVPPRNELVKTAAKFLSSVNVVNSSSESKVGFLKKKGLSDAEIDLAFKQADVIIQSRAFENPNRNVQAYMPPWPYRSRWSKYRDVVDTIAIAGALSYAVYWFYKKYLSPFLFGRSKKSLDSRIADLDRLITHSMSEIKLDVVKIKEEVMKASEKKIETLNRQLEELKHELASLKKLLLNRKQFPTSSVPTAPLSIPAWQMAASSAEKEVEEEGIGSGTNGSDSSLEMIKE